MKIKHVLSVILIMFSAANIAHAQSDIYGLKLYGFFQTSFYQQQMRMKQMSGVEQTKNQNTFWQQQMNLFLSKDISNSFSAFVNFELTNSFSTERNWGAFNLEEAWLRYSYSDLLNIRGGMFIPSFNNLNTIKNRTIILPYIFRPLVYETALKEIMSTSNFVPQRANIEVSGELPAGSDLRLNYSLYAGNSEDAYTATDSSRGGTSGTDTTTFKLFGGRIGLDYANLKLGFSATQDKHNQTASGIGNINRTRLGVDLSYSLAGFNLETEFIRVLHQLTDEQKAKLSAAALPGPMAPAEGQPGLRPGASNFDKTFYYANLAYNINESLYAYTKFDYIKDNTAMGGEAIKGYSFGGGFKPNEDILLKLQFQQIKSSGVNVKYYLIGASVFF